MLHLHPTILSNYYKNYANTTGIGPQGAKDNDYPVAINLKTCKYQLNETYKTLIIRLITRIRFTLDVRPASGNVLNNRNPGRENNNSNCYRHWFSMDKFSYFASCA